MEVESTPKQKPTKRAQNPSRIDNLAPYNIADDILSKQSSATLEQWLQIPAQRRNLANALRCHLISTPSVNSLEFIDDEPEKKTTSCK
ncbi:4588_t:CDS:1, partial [Funneliformis mosseae]